MRLEGKCVKVIDSDISIDTKWTKCYAYVITKLVNIKDNATLCIEDGTKVYLLNEITDFSEQNGGGLYFQNGTKLCAGDLCIQAVELVGDCYVISTKTEANLTNNGITFYGDGEEEQNNEEEQVEESFLERVKEMSNEEKCLYSRQYHKKRCIVNKNSSKNTLFKFKSLSLKYVQGLTLYYLNNNTFCGKNICILNGVNEIFNAFPLNLINTDISLCNLTIKNTNSYTQQISFGIGYETSTLLIKKSLSVYKGNSVFNQVGLSNEYFLTLDKCCKLDVKVSTFGSQSSSQTTVLQEPEFVIPNLNDLPFIENICVKSKVLLKNTPF